MVYQFLDFGSSHLSIDSSCSSLPTSFLRVPTPVRVPSLTIANHNHSQTPIHSGFAVFEVVTHSVSFIFWIVASFTMGSCPGWSTLTLSSSIVIRNTSIKLQQPSRFRIRINCGTFAQMWGVSCPVVIYSPASRFHTDLLDQQAPTSSLSYSLSLRVPTLHKRQFTAKAIAGSLSCPQPGRPLPTCSGS